ncbi:AvrE-family type 3 secretion system effector [Pseudomonas abietaniphila]|uniref:Pathogenicity factor n=1 Tax=Pseudomonas abietaniphila TaxID=89065 RepID=A0A1G7U905_9PSED|nr:AvrE-family type 3 secretion system effector [Pseudomonas abietaniphila]SDG43519.1 Pathogenicity factor [Pseudomonas abietaniphila]
MALPPVSLGQTSHVSNVSLNSGASETSGPKQRNGVFAKMASASQSAISKGRNFTGGLFRARSAEASSVTRSSRAPSPTNATTSTVAAPQGQAIGGPSLPSRAPSLASEHAPPQAPTPVGPEHGAAAPEVAIPLTPRLTMALNNQRLVFGELGVTNRTENLLDSVLNRPGERYQGLAELKNAPDKTEYLLSDRRSRLVHAHASDLAVSVFKSSDHQANASTMKMPGDAHRAHITGVHLDADGNAFRIHEKKLYTLNGDEWQPHAFTDDLKSLQKLGSEVYAIDSSGGVRALSHPGVAVPFEHDVKALTHVDGALIALTADGDKRLHLERRDGLGNGHHAIHALTDDHGPLDDDETAKPTAIVLQGNQLLVSTATGALRRAELPDDLLNERLDSIGTGETHALEPLQLTDAPASNALQKVLGQHRYGEFFTDDDQLFAKIKDRHGDEHSASWNAQANAFVPGWNLSQVLMLDRQQGLPQLAPAASEQIQLPRGRIARHEDDLLAQDPRTGEWKKTSEKGIKGLIAGRDGFAYVIDKDNTLKQLKVVPQATAHSMSNGVDLTLPGRTTEAKGTIMRGAEHVAVEKAAIQNDQRYMTLSEGVLRLHDQNGERAKLPQIPGEGDIAGIGSDGKDWFALKDGTLHQMSGAAADPKRLSSPSARQWTQPAVNGLPAGATLENLTTDNEGRLCLTASTPGANPGDAAVSNDYVRGDAGDWSPATPSPARANTPAHQHFDNLAAGEPAFTRRGNIKTSFNVLGRNNVETATPTHYAPHSLTQNYVTAHLASTGAFKVPADSIQHAWSGREGLRPVYDREIETLRQLSEAVRNLPAVNPAPMAERLQTLGQRPLTEPVAELSELFEWFQKTVSDDMQKTLREVAQDQGAMLKNGDVNMAYRARKPPKTDLLDEVSQLLKGSGIRADDPLGKMVKDLQDNHFTLEHRNPTSMIGDSRKRGDNQTLLCARLAANAQVMRSISDMLDELVANPHRPKADIDLLAGRLATLHNDTYDNNPLKRYTDAGFRSYSSLEASYDATKSLLKYMRKENHPVKRNVLEGLQTTPGQLTENLTKALRDLEPRESLKINRNYGGGVTGGITGPAGDAFLGFRGAIDPERTYGMTFTRFDRGLKVSMNREGALSGTASFGFGGGLSDTKTTPGDSHQNVQSNGGWFGGSLDAKHKYTENTALSFFIREDEMDAFMEDLLNKPLHSSQRTVANGLKPMELMNRGVEHEVRTTGKHNFDLELNANVESRTNYGQTDAEPVAGFMRFGVGLLANLALLNAERERTRGRGNDGLKTDIYSSNRARFLEKGSVAGYGRLFSTLFTSRPNDLFIAGGAPTGVTASLSFDNKTGKTYDVRFKDALPVHSSDLKSLESSLEKAFPAIRQEKPDGKSVDERLAAMQRQYAGQTVENDAQHSALTSLAQTQRQETASKQGLPLMSLMDMLVKHNNVNRIDQAALSKRGIDAVKQMLGRDVHPGNAECIHELLGEDPQLKTLLDDLKSATGTTRAEIKLEVKDAVKKHIEDAAIKGTLTNEALKNTLSDRGNLRIKSIAVFRTAAKDDSLGVPLPYVSFKSGSNLSIERLRGEVTFEYGLDQEKPKTFTLDGELADKGDSQPALDMADAAHGTFRPR